MPSLGSLHGASSSDAPHAAGGPGAREATRGAAGRRLGGLLAALGVLGTGAFILATAGSIPVPPLETGIGPRALPYVVGALLTAVGAALAVQELRGRTVGAEEGEDVDSAASIDWATLLRLALFLAAHVVLVEPAGWPVAAAVLFTGAAWSLGARPVWRAAAVAVVLALALQAVFAGLLGVGLPAGPLLEGVPFLNG
ncbi:tripartite tricarboxylate transporter TctB family protein [Sinomonas halotolerans]|uniref:Tripartite tricarboxylate transporter TctB family protein n=1 Tax=Sinomonas halotolerans TaxID=1644133 RepID=A0ABU9WVD8_9MICC